MGKIESLIQFSLLVPTRARPIFRKNLLDSILNTAKNHSNIEILFAVDEDDIDSMKNIETLKIKFKKLNIKMFKREQSIFTNKDYYNWLASKSVGKYIWAIADDVIFKIPEWDVQIALRLENYINHGKADRIVCVGLKDSTPKPKKELPPFPCFPLVTREAYEFFEFVLHPCIPNWGADYLLYLLYTGIGRYLNLDYNVWLDHISWHSRMCSEDEIGKKIRAVFGRVQHDSRYNVDINATSVVPLQIKIAKEFIKTRIKKPW